MGRQEGKLKKLEVLQVIKDKKGVLFGAGKDVTKAEKEKAWREVLKKAQSLEIAGAQRRWRYARDGLFGVWKSRTLNKRDNARKSEAEGGKQILLDDFDQTILDIIEDESPAVEVLKLPKCCESYEGPSSPQVSQVAADNVPDNNEENIRKHTKRKCSAESSSKDFKRLRNELMRVEIYYRQLKCLKLERELNLSQSEFTVDMQKRCRCDSNFI